MKPSAYSGARQALRDSFQPYSDMLGDGIDNAILYNGGKIVNKTVVCTNNGAITVNLFNITGSVKILEICGNCDDATDSTTFSGVKFSIIDSNSGTDDICGTVDCSGVNVSGFINRIASSGTALNFSNSDQCRIIDPTLSDVKAPFVVVPYYSDNQCTLRFHYTGDATTNVTWTVSIRYIPRSDNGVVTPL